jgi:uncharacterized protein (TIGR04551 family)
MTLARSIALVALLTPAMAFAQDDGADAPAADPAPAAEAPAAVEAPAEADAPAEAAPRTFETYAQSNPPSPAGGEGGGSSADWRRISEAELLEPSRTYPYIETHGYFRFRADSFWNLDLDTRGTSSVLAPVESLLDPDGPDNTFNETAEDTDLWNEYTDRGAEHLAGANIRFRLSPIFQITEKLRIHLELNMLDNMVLGSTADGQYGDLRAEVPLVAFSGGQVPSYVNITQAYGEVNTFFGTIRLGRQASHWGLGILANGGGSYSALREPRVSYRGLSMAGHGCVDCDFGDYVDRAMFITNLFDHYIALAWDYNYAGPTDEASNEFFGQPRELSNYDDTRSYVFSIFSRPIRPEEIAARNRQIKELRRPAFDYGFYLVYRTQRLSAERYEPEDSPDDYTWFPRGARAVIPDLWLRFQSEPAFRTRIRLELEAAAIFGSIDNADPNAFNDDAQRDIRQFGAALEFEYVRSALATGLNAGFATGRTLNDEGGDECNPVPSGFNVNDSWALNSCEPTLTNFRFDRNYFVDMIMFREVIGTVTNATYFNPFFQYDLFSKQDDNLGIRLDLITAFAADAATTPSGDGFYGVETDLTLYYREPNYGADISAGFYFPGSAFDAREGRQVDPTIRELTGNNNTYDRDVSANPAYTLQGRFFWAF